MFPLWSGLSTEAHHRPLKQATVSDPIVHVCIIVEELFHGM